MTYGLSGAAQVPCAGPDGSPPCALRVSGSAEIGRTIKRHRCGGPAVVTYTDDGRMENPLNGTRQTAPDILQEITHA